MKPLLLSMVLAAAVDGGALIMKEGQSACLDGKCRWGIDGGTAFVFDAWSPLVSGENLKVRIADIRRDSDMAKVYADGGRWCAFTKSKEMCDGFLFAYGIAPDGGKTGLSGCR